MSIRQGNKVLSAGQSLTQNLFDFKWADHILDDIQWLRADTFTWHDGRVYEAAYQHLLAEWNEVGDVPSTEIIAGIQIYYRLAPDGHKICSASQEDEAVAIYEATGIAWYYILDTTNQRFKLPRTKFGFVGLRDNDVGKYIQSEKVLLSSGSGVADYTEVNKATQMYLYFFVGNFAQSAVVNTAGINAALVDEIQGECIDLQNNKQDAATSVNYNNITNCITEIPQDINLELNNGTLTLKAGSKLYKPNGAGVFDTFIVETDLSRSTWGSGSTDLMVAFDTVNSTWGGFDIPNCYSGPTAPTGATNMLWYDTTNNKVKQTSNSGSTWNDGWTLPIFIVSRSSSAITGIQQVFNGFGYIGSTVFVLPGVKGLIPNGRNADGTLKNASFTTDKVILSTKSVNGIYDLMLSSNYLSGGINTYSYDEKNNINIWYGNKSLSCYIGSATMSGGKFSSIDIKTAFHAVDYSEADFVIAFQRPTAENNYTWYRKYKSGWVEQGGRANLGATVTFPVIMTNTNYTLVITSNSGDTGTQSIGTSSLTTSSFYANRYTGGSNLYSWQISGMAA